MECFFAVCCRWVVRSQFKFLQKGREIFLFFTSCTHRWVGEWQALLHSTRAVVLREMQMCLTLWVCSPHTVLVYGILAVVSFLLSVGSFFGACLKTLSACAKTLRSVGGFLRAVARKLRSDGRKLKMGAHFLNAGRKILQKIRGSFLTPLSCCYFYNFQLVYKRINFKWYFKLVKNFAASCITGISDVPPIMMLTSGFIVLMF